MNSNVDRYVNKYKEPQGDSPPCGSPDISHVSVETRPIPAKYS